MKPVPPSALLGAKPRETGSELFARLYLGLALLAALTPAALVAVGLVAPRLGLMSETFGVKVLAFDWAPRIALSTVAAGLFGVLIAYLACFSRFWFRAVLALAITTLTLYGYVWERQVRSQEAVAISPAR